METEQLEKQEADIEAVRAAIRLIGPMSLNKTGRESLCRAIRRTHRTELQSWARAICTMLAEMATMYEDCDFDLRSHGATAWAHELKLKDVLEPFLPYI